jgi:hypothetical protein
MEDGQFNHPFAIAVSQAGNVYVGEGGFQYRVQRFTGEGAFLSKWGVREPEMVNSASTSTA